MTYPKGMLTCPKCNSYGTITIMLDDENDWEVGCPCGWWQPKPTLDPWPEEIGHPRLTRQVPIKDLPKEGI